MFSDHRLIAFETIVIKEVRRFMRIWTQTMLPPVITISLYFVIFGNLVGSRIGEMGGFRYMEFIVPGLIMMAVIQNSYSNVVSSFFSQKFQRSVEELLVAPIPNYVILSGFIAGGMARGLCVGFIVTLVSLFFAELRIFSPLIMISVVLFTSLVFSLGGFINAVFANNFDDVSIIPTFVLTPLIYLGGVFYSIELLPPFWQLVSRLNPIFYMVNTFRYGILGTSDIDVAWAFAMLVLFAVLLFGACIWLLRRGTGIRS
ncbi:MAG: ABC transporter permease [Gammaproteobacteria bacterium]|nr:ABC transporter permease [Gammaproteobacteria bacterium]MDE0507309.1 ABC transporter permease [Gammaproteobacteria bacterium]MXX05593.1 ABC transporter permease [Gammaproteobacteria bacterium]MXY90688.1 ABC transporter permease [Gammaproteobacteria bacterium]MYA37903.1 ABC transporter permease [Gammaproteobacteria bacterium]